jgi:DNA-binding NarL/FixJ family response regulator
VSRASEGDVARMLTKILLAYDHQVFRHGLRSLIEQDETLEVAAEASTVEEAVAGALRVHPQVAIVDSWLGGLSALEVTRRILQSVATKVLIFCTHLRPVAIDKLVKAGAFGFLSRESSQEELFSALRALQRGERYVSSSAAASLLETFSRSGDGDLSVSRLTGREREVLQLIAEGLSSKEIAVRLCLAVRTVDSHRAHLMTKLEVNKVSGLVRIAIREGLIAP